MPSPRPLRPLPSPMLAVAAGLPEDTAGYAFELKWDGVRALVRADDGVLRINSRLGNDITAKFPELAPLADALEGHSATFDGEIVVLDRLGRPDFGLVQRRYTVADPATAKSRSQELPATYCIFDLLELDGASLESLPYEERRRRLEALRLDGPTWQVPAYHRGDGRALLEASQALRFEGIVAKELGSPYRAGLRSPSWIKVRNRPRQEFVVGGWSEGEGSRHGGIGSLLVGYYAPKAGKGPPGQPSPGKPSFTYAGRVGSGFDDRTLAELEPRLRRLERPRNPFAAGPFEPGRGLHFVLPEVVVEVEASGVTHGGVLRQPSFKGIRYDKQAHEVVWEQQAPPPGAQAEGAPVADAQRSPKGARTGSSDMDNANAKEGLHGRDHAKGRADDAVAQEAS